MIIVDTALEKREREGNPVRVGLVGAGYMGRGIALQILTSTRGMRLAAISNRTLATAGRAYREAGVADVKTVQSVDQLEQALANKEYVITEDPSLLCRARNIDAIIEATGEVEAGACRPRGHSQRQARDPDERGTRRDCGPDSQSLRG